MTRKLKKTEQKQEYIDKLRHIDRLLVEKIFTLGKEKEARLEEAISKLADKIENWPKMCEGYRTDLYKHISNKVEEDRRRIDEMQRLFNSTIWKLAAIIIAAVVSGNVLTSLAIQKIKDNNKGRIVYVDKQKIDVGDVKDARSAVDINKTFQQK